MQKATISNNKSSTSRSRLNMNESRTSPQRKKISQQSIRQFKIEIDHQIAKCLDTLDRQGLKFLKETLKTSNIFNSTNLQIDQKNESSQSLKTIKGQMKMFESQVQPKNRISQQQSKKCIKKDFLQENKKAFMKIKQPKKQIESKYRSNSSARIKPIPVPQLVQETKISQRMNPTQSQKQKKRQAPQNASSSRVNQKQLSMNSRVVKKTVIENKKTNEKISLGQKLNKRMSQLNISKVGPGKNNKNIAQKSHTNLQQSISKQPQQLIQQEIFQTNEHQVEDSYSENKSEAESQSIIKSSIMASYHEYLHPEIKLSQKINPLKPSNKDKLNQNESILAESKIEESRLPEKQIDQKSFVQKLSASIQVNHEDLKSHDAQNVQEKNQSAQMSLIVQKINKLSPQKLAQIQKYLDFIENKSNNDQLFIDPIKEKQKDLPKVINQDTKQVNLHNLPQVYSVNSFQKYEELQKEQNKIKAFQRCSSYNEDQLIANRNKILPLIPKSQSRKGMRQKKQKASMIYGSGNMKSASRSRIKVDLDLDYEEKSQGGIKVFKSQHLKPYLTSRRDGYSQNDPGEKILLQSEKPLKMQKIDFNENQVLVKNESGIMKKSSIKFPMNSLKISQIKQNKQDAQKDVLNIESQKNIQKSLQIQQNNSLNIQNTEVKMLNISNKKMQIIKKPQNKTQLKFKILSNRGHPSLFGLTGIELYTIQNKRVIVSQKQLSLNSNSTSKLLYLFNGNHYTTQEENIFQSSLTKNEIIVELDKENQRIGGILVFNFNKSSLQNSKQVDELEIYHNDEKMWKGMINPGVYKQITDYATKIQFMSNFRFPTFQNTTKNDELTIKKDKTQIWIDKKQKEQTFSLPKQNYIAQNQDKVIHKSQSRRNNTIAYQIERNDISINFLTKKIQPDQQYQNVEPIKAKENIQTKSRVHSVAFDQKPAFQKKTINTARQENYDDFDTMLKGLQQNINREKSKSKLTPASVSLENQYASIQNKQKSEISNIKYSYQTQNPKKQQRVKVSNNEIDDFMNDSIFNDKPHSRIPSIKRKIEPPKKQEFRQDSNNENFYKKEESFSKKNKDINIDDFLGQLQDVMKNKESTTKKTNKTDKRIQIPNLPKGSIVQIQIYENWGHQAYVGLQAIQFFDEDGKNFMPQQIDCNKNPNNINLLQSLNNRNIVNRDEKIQTKLGYQRSSPTILTLKFSQPKIFSLIRVWNYNGHRVHSNIGIKQCAIKIDGKQCFIGQLKKNESTPENFYKNFEAILMTNDHKIIKKIKDNDWLTELKNKIKEEKNLFKSTLINFNRPKTKNAEQKAISKQNFEYPAQMVTKEIKLPKRNCWQYEPPQIPQGNILIFLLHDTWGDQNFIGLNGIQIFDGSGKILGKDEISKIRAFPSTTGEKNDKRVIQNVLNGLNFTNLDSNIWLSTFQSDIEKLQSGKPNTIIIQLRKLTKISGVNFYNYSKTPQRGVRQIQIQINNFIAFRGYLKMFNDSNPQNTLHTTINFTKNIQLLEKMNYEGYNQDNIDQNVAFVNQRKLVKI